MGNIMAANQPLSLFISGKMGELTKEQDALIQLGGYQWLPGKNEEITGETRFHPRLPEIEACDIYIGLFWLDYAQWVIDEFRYARQSRKPCLIYEKHVLVEQRSPELTTFLTSIQQEFPTASFQTTEQLSELVQKDVMRLLATQLRPTFNSAIRGTKSKGIAIGTNLYPGMLRSIQE
jgi:hypothetical protein